MSNLRSRAEEAVNRVLENMVLDGNNIEPSSKLTKLGIDSLDKVEIAMDLEDELDIDIWDEFLIDVKTVDDLITHISEAMEAQGK